MSTGTGTAVVPAVVGECAGRIARRVVHTGGWGPIRRSGRRRSLVAIPKPRLSPGDLSCIFKHGEMGKARSARAFDSTLEEKRRHDKPYPSDG